MVFNSPKYFIFIYLFVMRSIHPVGILRRWSSRHVVIGAVTVDDVSLCRMSGFLVSS